MPQCVGDGPPEGEPVLEIVKKSEWKIGRCLWQDGSITKDMDSAVLLPMRHTDEHDFFPNSFVRDKTDDLDEGGDPTLPLLFPQLPT
jgi:hypothetical protein